VIYLPCQIKSFCLRSIDREEHCSYPVSSSLTAAFEHQHNIRVFIVQRRVSLPRRCTCVHAMDDARGRPKTKRTNVCKVNWDRCETDNVDAAAASGWGVFDPRYIPRARESPELVAFEDRLRLPILKLLFRLRRRTGYASRLKYEQICIRFLFASSRDIANGKRVCDAIVYLVRWLSGARICACAYAFFYLRSRHGDRRYVREVW